MDFAEVKCSHLSNSVCEVTVKFRLGRRHAVHKKPGTRYFVDVSGELPTLVEIGGVKQRVKMVLRVFKKLSGRQIEAIQILKGRRDQAPSKEKIV